MSYEPIDKIIQFNLNLYKYIFGLVYNVKI